MPINVISHKTVHKGSHILNYRLNYNGMPEFMRKCSMLAANVKNSSNNAKYLKSYGWNVESTRDGKLQ